MKKLGLIFFMLVFIANSGCTEGSLFSSEPENNKSGTVNFKLSNSSSENTHMWITGEAIGPNNKISPNTNRQVTYNKSSALLDEARAHDEVTVFAGRNGNVLASGSIMVDRKTKSVTGTFNGSSVSVK